MSNQKENRFYRQSNPIGIGSIVIRSSSDGKSIDIGQVTALDTQIGAGKRWLVFCNKSIERWSESTIMRRLDGWEEAAFVAGATKAAIAMMDKIWSADAPLILDEVLSMIARGEIAP